MGYASPRMIPKPQPAHPCDWCGSHCRGDRCKACGGPQGGLGQMPEPPTVPIVTISPEVYSGSEARVAELKKMLQKLRASEKDFIVVPGGGYKLEVL